jgi:hypothetical protein
MKKFALLAVALTAVAGCSLNAWAQAAERQPGQRQPRPNGDNGQRGMREAGQPGQRGQGGGQGQRQGGGPGGGMGRGMMGGGMGGGMFGGGGDQTVSVADFTRYADRLQLNDDQRASAKTLLEGYRAEVRTIDDAAAAKRQEAMEKFRENRDPAVFEGIRATMEEAAKERTKAETAFFEDVKSLLSDDQTPKWEGVERMRRRDTGLRRGRLSGERMDVVRLVEELKLEQAALAPLSETLATYEEQLDRELTARNKIYDEIGGKIGELMRNQDMETAQKELDRARDAGLKVREINRKFARQAQDLLPEGKKAEMALAVKKASHPDIYRESQVARRLLAAEKITDLDETQKKAIAELKEKHTREINGVNEKLAAAAEEMELKFSMQDLQNRFRGEPGAGDDLRQQRRDLEEGVTESLKKILTPEQLEQLPRDRQQGGPGQRRRGGQQQDDGNEDL